MVSKRKASAQLTGPPKPAPSNSTPAHLQTIETLASLECALSRDSINVENLSTAFPALSLAQQHIDLYTIFDSPVFKYNSPLAAYFKTWMDVRELTLENLIEWKHGRESNSLPHFKPSGAKLATAAVKSFRGLQTEGRSSDLLSALRMKELDYLLLMLATQSHNIENMIPGNKARIEELASLLRPQNNPPVQVPPQVVASQGAEPQDNYREIALGFRIDTNLDLPQVVGHDDLSQKISNQMLIPTLFGHLLEPTDRVGSQTFLLFGPSGTGKTLFGQSLAKKHDMTFFKVDTAGLTSKYVGDTEKIIKALSEEAVANAPALLFFDEVESLTRKRQGHESDFDRRFKNRFLEMFNTLSQTPSVMVIGATNRSWDIDEAFLSRFQQKVFFGLPRREDHMTMLANYLKGKREDIPGYQLDLLCTFMQNYSGRDVTNALMGLHMKMFTDLMATTSFIPVSFAPIAR
ncbi:MAG: hypothetical protein Q9195_009225 [Heterodermia aff. obscurata]